MLSPEMRRGGRWGGDCWTMSQESPWGEALEIKGLAPGRVRRKCWTGLGLGPIVAIISLCLNTTIEKGPMAAAVAPSPEVPWAN